jgi:uncharacterized protein
VSDPLYIRLRDIPDEGLDLDVEVPSSLLANALEGVETRLDRDHVRVNGSLSKQGENAFLRGSVTGSLDLPCARCAGPATLVLDVELNTTLTPPMGDDESDTDDVLDDVDFATLVNDKGEWVADLRELLREQIVLAIPIQPLCREDCAGLCARCGKALNEGPCGCPEEHPIDPRFAALEKLREKAPE